MLLRKAVRAGSWYDANTNELCVLLDGWLDKKEKKNVSAIVVP